jgi:hypothetical protein
MATLVNGHERNGSSQAVRGFWTVISELYKKGLTPYHPGDSVHRYMA